MFILLFFNALNIINYRHYEGSMTEVICKGETKLYRLPRPTCLRQADVLAMTLGVKF